MKAWRARQCSGSSVPPPGGTVTVLQVQVDGGDPNVWRIRFSGPALVPSGGVQFPLGGTIETDMGVEAWHDANAEDTSTLAARQDDTPVVGGAWSLTGIDPALIAPGWTVALPAAGTIDGP